VPLRVRDAFASALLGEPLITATGLQRAMRHSEQHSVPMHDAVVALGLVEERASYRLFARAAGLPFHDADGVTPSPLALKLVPERVARRHALLPVAVDDRTITYLTATPYDLDADQDVKFTTGRAPVPTLTWPTELRAGLMRVYPNRMDVGELVAKARTASPLVHLETVTIDFNSDSAIINLCNTLVARAVDAGASDLHLDRPTAAFSCGCGWAVCSKP
jgi:type IV pilus assembly protein PilB